MTRPVIKPLLAAVLFLFALGFVSPAGAQGRPAEPTPVPISPTGAAPTATALWPTATPVACPDALEPNAQPGSGTLLISGDILDALTLSPLGDTDFFLLYAKAGEFTRLTTHTTDGVDTRLRIYDPAGTLVAENDDYQPSNPAAQINFQAPGDGFFAVAVDSRVPTDWGCRTYSIDANTVPPPTATPTITPPATATATPYPTAIPAVEQPDRFEPNYDPAHAANLGVGQTLILNFNPDPPGSGAVDNDFFRLYAKAGQQLQIETAALAPGLDTNLILYAADGVTPITGNDDCAPGQLASCLTWAPEQNQLVYLLVGPVGALPETVSVGARNYTLSVTDVSALPATPPAIGSPAGRTTWQNVPKVVPSATPTPTVTPTPTPLIILQPLNLAPPTPTPLPQHSLTVGISVYYDQNNNRAPDIDEGITGISVRVLDRQTNRLITQIFTNEEGYAAVTVTAPGDIRVSVPYLGFNRTIRPPGDAISIRMPPLRLPSLIP